MGREEKTKYKLQKDKLLESIRVLTFDNDRLLQERKKYQTEHFKYLHGKYLQNRLVTIVNIEVQDQGGGVILAKGLTFVVGDDVIV